MKRFGYVLTAFGLILMGITISKTAAFTDFDALQWAYENELFSREDGFESKQKLKREYASLIFYNYINNLIDHDRDAVACKASDIPSNSTYKKQLSFLCDHGILLGEKNKLLPKQGLTRAQAVVMMIRIIDQSQKESTLNGQHRSENYFKRATQLGIDTKDIKTIKNQTISFQELINLLYASQHPDEELKQSSEENGNTLNDLDSSEDLLEELLKILNG